MDQILSIIMMMMIMILMVIQMRQNKIMQTRIIQRKILLLKLVSIINGLYATTQLQYKFYRVTVFNLMTADNMI